MYTFNRFGRGFAAILYNVGGEYDRNTKESTIYCTAIERPIVHLLKTIITFVAVNKSLAGIAEVLRTTWRAFKSICYNEILITKKKPLKSYWIFVYAVATLEKKSKLNLCMP